MACYPSFSFECNKSESIRRHQNHYSVNQEQEDEWMILYTKIYTYELVFAVDLMSYVMQENNLLFENFIYPNCLGRPSPSYFDEAVRKFVELTMTKYKANSINMLEKNLNLDSPSYEEFKAYVNASAYKVESLSYSEYAYLVFCVTLAQMCSVAYMHGIFKAPDFGIMLMCRTYSNFKTREALPLDAWNDIKRVARETIELLEMEKKMSVSKRV